MESRPPDQHRKSIRLKGYDYTQPGGYFVTIVTIERQNLFGEILNSAMRVNDVGKIIQSEWLRLSKRFTSIHLDEFVVMPNHIHGIILLADEARRGTADPARSILLGINRRAPTSGGLNHEEFGKPVSGSIPTIIRSFKSSTTLRINFIGLTQGGKVWQRNYYEHIIRNEQELDRIRAYIRDNPLKWAMDSENPDQE